MMLTDLDPVFLRCVIVDGTQEHVRVDTLEEAEGVMFLCPQCYKANDGPVGTHLVICWSLRAPHDAVPGPGLWVLTGTSFDDLSLTAPAGSSSSILLTSGCHWHGWITNGEVRQA